ncbi:MAG: hypothetical protein H6842_11095 [Rhodospirillaceae bacterium]|nr:hypothetical protein [Rhodospirillaceae bacterium]
MADSLGTAVPLCLEVSLASLVTAGVGVLVMMWSGLATRLLGAKGHVTLWTIGGLAALVGSPVWLAVADRVWLEEALPLAPWHEVPAIFWLTVGVAAVSLRVGGTVAGRLAGSVLAAGVAAGVSVSAALSPVSGGDPWLVLGILLAGLPLALILALVGVRDTRPEVTAAQTGGLYAAALLLLEVGLPSPAAGLSQAAATAVVLTIAMVAVGIVRILHSLSLSGGH